MADRFWVGGSGTWSTTATTNWSTTSGGPSGASRPTTSDSVFFDQPGTYTVTMTGGLNCLDITVSAGTVTFATGTSPTLAISGSMSLIAGTIWTSTGTITFNSTTTGRTVTTNGVAFTPAITFSGVGGGWTLGSALSNSGNAINVTAGTFNTANYSITSNSFSISGTLARTINLGSSTITLAATSTFSCNSLTNLTFNPGTSTINFSGLANISSVGLTFYNVSFTSTLAGTRTITGENTFNNLSIRGPGSPGVVSVTVDSRQTINGVFSTTNTLGYNRVLISSATTNLSQSLILNGSVSVSDCDFKDIFVEGSSSPLTGTRLGNLTGCSGINFSTPKTVYWSNTAGGSWYSNSWASTDGGVPDHSNFPLPQDTATITNTVTASATISMPTMVSSINASARTLALTFSLSTAVTNTDFYGDLILGSGVGIAFNSRKMNFCGEKTQVLSPAGQTFGGGLIVDSIGGALELGSAVALSGGYVIDVVNGTFDTKNYAVTVDNITSSYSNLRAIKLGSSSVTLKNNPNFDFTISTNLTFEAGTSTINVSSVNPNFTLATGVTFYNVSFSDTNGTNIYIGSNNTFNNITFPTSTSRLKYVSFSGNNTINGTLNAVGGLTGSPSNETRLFLYSSTLNSPVNLTVNVLNTSKCDFRDINILGNAVNTSAPFAGDLGGNTGIIFPAPKTVYWNLAGAVEWGRTAWASVSGGVPNSNNFPLAQDTAVFDDSSTVTGTVTVNAAWNIGNFDASARTLPATITLFNSSPNIYGNWKLGTGVNLTTNSGVLTFVSQQTCSITCNGTSFGCHINIQCVKGTVQLADALIINAARRLTLTSGTFDAVSYNVTIGNFSAETAGATLKMGSGTWTLSGTGGVWYVSNSLINFYKGTANIVLSDNTTAARTFGAIGTSYSYNKLTIGGDTSTSTLTILGNNTFTELASTKTVAHTIALGTTTQTFGKWAVTGTAGNIVSVTGTGTSHVIAGDRVSGVDYLAMGAIGFSATSPGEFYAGANSTGTLASIIKTAAPAPVTRYWVGGTGTWDATTTTRWSTTSGGAGGASVPTSADAVIFDSASSSAAYTVTCAGTHLRCASLTMSGPGASAIVTWAGSAPITVHGNLTLAATRVTRSYSGTMTFSGSTTGKVITTNGIQLSPLLYINGIGCEYSFGSAVNIGVGGLVGLTAGSLSLGGFALNAGQILSSAETDRSISFGSSTVTLTASTPIDFGTTEASLATLNFSAGTSNLICNSGSNPVFNGRGLTFYNVNIASNQVIPFAINGKNTFNNLTLTPLAVAGVRPMYFSADQTINGIFTAGGNSAINRGFIRSDIVGISRKLTCNAVSLSDLDIQDIVFLGASAPVSGTRLGDCKGNTGVTFPTAKTVYWSTSTAGFWNATSWATTLGGTPAIDNFPLAQDTAVIPASTPNGATALNITLAYALGTVDMSARATTNTITLATPAATSINIYGDLILGAAISLSSANNTLIFTGRNSQNIVSAGRQFQQSVTIDSLGGSVTLQDAFSSIKSATSALSVLAGTFNANTYNVTFSGVSSTISISGTSAKTVNIGSGTWTLTGSGTSWSVSSPSNLNIIGTGKISLNSASAKTFAGGNIDYSGITINQDGAGILTITGNNTFKDITNSYGVTGASSILLGSTTQTLTQFTGSGTLGKLLTISGTSTTAPANLILTGSTDTAANYVNVSNVRMYKKGTGTWQFGSGSRNLGSYGAVFAVAVTVFKALGNFFAFF